jgi:hypothetical protein
MVPGRAAAAGALNDEPPRYTAINPSSTRVGQRSGRIILGHNESRVLQQIPHLWPTKAAGKLAVGDRTERAYN